MYEGSKKCNIMRWEARINDADDKLIAVPIHKEFTNIMGWIFLRKPCVGLCFSWKSSTCKLPMVPWNFAQGWRIAIGGTGWPAMAWNFPYKAKWNKTRRICFNIQLPGKSKGTVYVINFILSLRFYVRSVIGWFSSLYSKVWTAWLHGVLSSLIQFPGDIKKTSY